MTHHNIDDLEVEKKYSQVIDVKNPSLAFEMKNKEKLLYTVKKELALFFDSLESTVEDFVSCGNGSAKRTVLLAVSGGVDSQVMLHSVFALSKVLGYTISVVTVNHNLRDADETKADADLVFSYCSEQLNVPCTIVTIAPNEVQKLSQKRNKGIEEAARAVRYTRIKQHALEIGADVVFFAHNRDDQLETLLQHFLQGASAGISGFSSSGIRKMLPFPDYDGSRASLTLFRPLLCVTRKEIELYAKEHCVPFREDTTNAEVVYLRNKIRHKLVPILNEHFIGWDTGILTGSEKALQEALFIDELSSQFAWEYKDGARIVLDDFFSLAFPVRARLLYKGFVAAGIDDRISYDIVKACCKGQKRIEGGGVEIFHKAGYLVVRKLAESTQIDQPFSITVTKCGTYSSPDGVFEVKSLLGKKPTSADTESGDNCIGEFHLPLKIRSKNNGDKIETAQGTHKTIKKIFSDWHVDRKYRLCIPIIEHNDENICVWGSIYGYPNWIVHKKNTEQAQKVYVYFIRNN